MRSVCNKTIEARSSAAHTNSQYNYSKQTSQVCVLPYTVHKTHIQPVLENIQVSFQNWPQPSSFSCPVTAMVWNHPGRKLKDHRWLLRIVAQGGTNTADKLSLWSLLCRCQPLPPATTDHLWGYSGQMAPRQWLLPTTCSSSTAVQTIMSLPKESLLWKAMGKPHNGNHTRRIFLIHSIPQAIHSVSVISLRWLEVCIMPKLTAGLLCGFRFSSFQTLLSPCM